MNDIKAGLFVATMNYHETEEAFGLPLSVYHDSQSMSCMLHLKLNFNETFNWKEKKIELKLRAFVDNDENELIIGEVDAPSEVEPSQKIDSSVIKTSSNYASNLNVILRINNIPLIGNGDYEFVVECVDCNGENYILDTWEFKVKHK